MTYPLNKCKKQITSELKKVLSQYKCGIKLETPPENMGDFAFPCFLLAPIIKKSPKEIANEIATSIEKPNFITKVEAKGGYVNFFVDDKYLISSTLKSILEMKEKYGQLQKKNKKVIIEHTSANPNGPLHVGRARNPIIGDTIVRIYKAAGYNVESQFYLDDLGKQVVILTQGTNDQEVCKEVKKFFNSNKYYPGGSQYFVDKPDHQRVGYYQIASNRLLKDEKISDEINELVKRSESGEHKVIELIHEAYDPILKGIEESLSNINITIDKALFLNIIDINIPNVI